MSTWPPHIVITCTDCRLDVHDCVCDIVAAERSASPFSPAASSGHPRQLSEGEVGSPTVVVGESTPTVSQQ